MLVKRGGIDGKEAEVVLARTARVDGSLRLVEGKGLLKKSRLIERRNRKC